MAATTQARTHSTTRPLLTAALVIGALLVAALLVWQGVAVQGTPDPTSPHLSPQAAVLNVAVLVFREGLECILVLTAITAGLMGSNGRYREPIAVGVGVGMVATVITWFVAVAIIDDLAS